jgi:hypothetical protein
MTKNEEALWGLFYGVAIDQEDRGEADVEEKIPRPHF